MDRIGFLFSGQGAQHAGMAQDFYMQNKRVRALFDAAMQIRPNIRDMCFSSDAETLKRTQNAQPCLYLTDLSAALVLEDYGVYPHALAGFSLGELPALAFGGAYDPIIGFEITCARGTFMGEASAAADAAMMAVLKLTNEAVEQVCACYDQLYPVNYNAPDQLVISGTKEALHAAKADITALGGRCVPLAVSGAFHSPFMASAAQKFGAYLKKQSLYLPTRPVYANLTATPYTSDVAYLLEQQMTHPVLWDQTIRNMHKDGINTFIEVGVGTTLQKLVAKILPTCRSFHVETCADAAAVAEEVL